MRKVTLLLVVVSACALTFALPASAQYPGTTSTTTTTVASSSPTTVAAQVLGETLTRPEVQGSAQAGAQTTGDSGGGLLPRTGAAIVTWTLVAALLVALGTALVVADRRRRRPTAER